MAEETELENADVRDWEREVKELKDKTRKLKRDVTEAKKRERSWESEAIGSRKDHERNETIAIKKN